MNRASFDFGGSRVVVTGGTSGIGNAIVLAFRDAGAAAHRDRHTRIRRRL